ncbi:hypothetical protein SEA_SIZEMORE_57 [Mycobacterium phage Sizemore]|nr:hypothetical protein SEA_KASEN3_57 [Mycobacterium phage Kasen3]
MAAIVLRSELHPSGSLMQHVATIDGIRIEAHQNEQAHNARTAGSWFLTIGLAGHPLRCHSQHRTLADARAFANAVIAAAGAGATHAQLVAAHDRVAHPERVVDLDVAVVDEDQDAAELVELPAAGPIVVVPCGAQKLDTAAPAGELYTSAHFALVLRAARRLAAEQAGRVFILSALHGLVDPADVLAPYDVKMGDPGSIQPAAIADQLRRIRRPTTITTLLPRAYAQALDVAAELAGAGDLVDLYADAPGIGYQRGVAARLVAA